MTVLSATHKVSTPSLKEELAERTVNKLTIYAAEIMYAGGMVAIDVNSEVQMAADTAGLKVLGICRKDVDNTDDGETIDPPLVGIFRLANSSSYPIVATMKGKPCYVEDDNTVAGWSTNLVAAGLIHDVDSNGVWVDMTAQGMAAARRFQNDKQVDKTDDYTVTAAIAYEGRSFFSCDKASTMEITLPSAVGGMRVGVKRASATAAHDVTIQAATGDTIEAYDGDCAAGKQIDNTVDAISEIIWLEAVDATHWKLDRTRLPKDIASWVKNDA